MTERELQLTADGTHTLFVPELDEHYHSVNGALQESTHVFIDAGLSHIHKEHIRLLEIGFGTGLNAFLTLKEIMIRHQQTIDYFTIERYPLADELTQSLNYNQLIWPEEKDLFQKLHQTPWNEKISLTDRFNLFKIEGDVNTCDLPKEIDLIYFDAFAPDKQPEMWSQEIVHKLYAHASPGCILVTYCAKGEVRRKMQKAGFNMKRLPGPPGKRHMLQGTKA